MTCKTTLFLLALVSCMSSGCAAMLPYGDVYDCPQMEKGRCVSVESAHAHALTGAIPGDATTSATGVGIRSGANSGEALGEAIEKYRKAVVTGKADAIELSRNELLLLIGPGQADEFTEALERFKKAVRSRAPGKAAEAEKKLREIHERAVAHARDGARLEYGVSNAATRQEFLGKYAQGQRTPAVLMPPVIMETHILPYQTEFNTLAGERTMWIPVEPARWTWPDKFNGGHAGEVGGTVRGSK
jgi:hypothetical protein